MSAADAAAEVLMAALAVAGKTRPTYENGRSTEEKESAEDEGNRSSRENGEGQSGEENGTDENKDLARRAVAREEALKGEWSDEELERLLHAVTVHGRDWGKVSAYMGSRTRKQCHDKAMKEIKAGRLVDPGNKVEPVLWTAEESNLLHKAVSIYGRKWAEISKVVGTKDRIQCHHKYENEIRLGRAQDPGNKRSVTHIHWSPEQTAQLREAVAKHGRDWEKVAAEVPGRKKDECRMKFEREVSAKRMEDVKGFKRSEMTMWTAEEVQLLHDAIEKHGRDWVAVSKEMGGKRSNLQCQRKADHERDHNRLDFGTRRRSSAFHSAHSVVAGDAFQAPPSPPPPLAAHPVSFPRHEEDIDEPTPLKKRHKAAERLKPPVS